MVAAPSEPTVARATTVRDSLAVMPPKVPSPTFHAASALIHARTTSWPEGRPAAVAVTTVPTGPAFGSSVSVPSANAAVPAAIARIAIRVRLNVRSFPACAETTTIPGGRAERRHGPRRLLRLGYSAATMVTLVEPKAWPMGSNVAVLP